MPTRTRRRAAPVEVPLGFLGTSGEGALGALGIIRHADPKQRRIVETPKVAPWVPPNQAAADAADVLKRLLRGDYSKMRTLKLVYLTDWEAFDSAWRDFLSKHPESDPVVAYVRSEMSKLS